MEQHLVIQELLIKENVDGLIIFCNANRFWYTNFQSSEGALIITKNTQMLFLDGRYYEAALQANLNKTINIQPYVALKTFLENQKQLNKSSFGFEYDQITYEKWHWLTKTFHNLTWIPINFSKIRSIKNNQEIQIMKALAQKTSQMFDKVLPLIKPGLTEIAVKNLFLHQFQYYNIDEPAFEIIIASGYRAAYPHAMPTNKIIEAGETIICDIGCRWQGYNSDMSRTIVLNKADDKTTLIYEIVKQAQAVAIAAIKHNVNIEQVDQAARNYITSQGYGTFFNHSTGHGIGINVHEYPNVCTDNKQLLKAGMIITVEPGIYIPEWGGIRLEDEVLVTEQGCEVITSSPKQLIY